MSPASDTNDADNNKQNKDDCRQPDDDVDVRFAHWTTVMGGWRRMWHLCGFGGVDGFTEVKVHSLQLGDGADMNHLTVQVTCWIHSLAHRVVSQVFGKHHRVITVEGKSQIKHGFWTQVPYIIVFLGVVLQSPVCCSLDKGGQVEVVLLVVEDSAIHPVVRVQSDGRVVSSHPSQTTVPGSDCRGQKQYTNGGTCKSK